MPSPANRVALYGALAIGLYTIENLLPSPLPWLRIGIANVAVVLALDELGIGPAWAVFILKLVVGSIFVGRFWTPFFWFAAVGGTASLALMTITKFVLGGSVTIVGTSIIGGFVHNIAQLALARLVLVPNNSVWLLLPIFGFLGIGTGALVGVVARLVQLRLIHGPKTSRQPLIRS
ncbi:MAG: Gx transporter family protein [candidate division WOR-3 bacterium]